MQAIYLAIGVCRFFYSLFCYKRSKKTIRWMKHNCCEGLNSVEHEEIATFPVYEWTVYKLKFLPKEPENKMELQR
jgi:hypothetical protein